MHISKISIKQGDVLLITSPAPFTKEHADALKARIRKELGREVPILILDSTASLTIIDGGAAS